MRKNQDEIVNHVKAGHDSKSCVHEPRGGSCDIPVYQRGHNFLQNKKAQQSEVAPYRAILRYYRCDILLGEVSTPPKWCDTPPPRHLVFTQARLCDTPFCNASLDCAIRHKNKNEEVLRYSGAGGPPQFLKKRSENAGANENHFHVGSHQFRESLRELLRE